MCQTAFQCKLCKACFKPQMVKINQSEFTIIYPLTWTKNTLFFTVMAKGRAVFTQTYIWEMSILNIVLHCWPLHSSCVVPCLREIHG